MNDDTTNASLPYATPAKRRRRWPSLPAPVAVVVIICGTLLVATPAVAACIIHGQSGYNFPDYLMALLVLTGGAGFIIVLLAILLAAIHRPDRDAGA